MRAVILLTSMLTGLLSGFTSAEATMLPLEVIGRYPLGECSSEHNSWGYPSMCQCAAGDFYFAAAGLCVSTGENPPDFMAAGKLINDEMTIGGETSGLVLAGDDHDFELILPATSKSMLQNRDGGYMEARGKLIYLPTLTREQRPAIVVDEITDGDTNERLLP